MVFESKVDNWLLLIVGLAMAMSLSAFSVLLFVQPTVPNVFLALFILPVGVILPLWVLISTKYTVTQNELKVRSGPFKWVIARKDISSITETRNPLSNPALSLDRLLICYGNDKKLMVSPEDKEGFLKALEED